MKLNKRAILIIMSILFASLIGCEVVEEAGNLIDETIEIVTNDKTADPTDIKTVTESTDNGPPADLLEGRTLLIVEGGDLSGDREPNAVVDVGFGDRLYWAASNEYGQLVKVVADIIILQDEENEPVLSTGRYYPDEAKVPGTEAPDLDEGHIIGDANGGVSNRFNIVPQSSTLNRHGDQAYMEKVIRDAGGCTDFVAIITYPNTETMIPSHFSYTYTINGTVIHDEFDNVDPDEVNASLPVNTDNQKNEVNNTASDIKENAPATAKDVEITQLDKKKEFVVIANKSEQVIDLEGWKIVSVTGNQVFVFPSYKLEPGLTVKVGDSDQNPDVNLHWMDGRGVWNNSNSDPAELYNELNELVDRYND